MEDNLLNHSESASVSNLLAGKKGLIMGVANNRSLAWGAARAAHQAGADLAFTYQGQSLHSRVEELAHSIGSNFLIECDVTHQESINSLFETIENKWGKFDFLIHSIAYSDKNELKGRFLDTSEENFLNAMNISCYSFISLVRRAELLMNPGGSFITFTYYGAEKVTPHYNVMGPVKAALEASVRYMSVDLGRKNIRINAISAGPVRTLASSAIEDFKHILRWNEHNAPLARNVTLHDLGGASLFLLSSLSSGVTGEVLHVDCGYHVVGMKAADSPTWSDD